MGIPMEIKCSAGVFLITRWNETFITDFHFTKRLIFWGSTADKATTFLYLHYYSWVHSATSRHLNKIIAFRLHSLFLLTRWINSVVFSCLFFCSHRGEPAESLGWGLWDLHPGVSDTGPLRQLLDAPSPGPLPGLWKQQPHLHPCHHRHHRYNALFWLPAKLCPGSQS